MFILGTIVGWILSVFIISTLDYYGGIAGDYNIVIIMWIGAGIGAVCGGLWDIHKMRNNIQEYTKSAETSASLILLALEEGSKFQKKHSWVVSGINIMHLEGESCIYTYMLVEEYIRLQDVEIMIKEANFDWETISDNNGRIWLRKIATFRNDKGFIKPLKEKILQKHPDWSVDTSYGGQLYARIWL